MATEIKVPNLPESVSSATVATWHFKVGDKVTREANLLDLETDKVMLEVPATDDGVLTEVRVEAGATVQAGDVLGVLGGAGEAAAPAASAPAAAPAPAAPSPQPAPAAASAHSEPAASADKPTTGPMGAPALGGETALPKSDSSASDGADHAARTAAANASQGVSGPAARKAMAESDLSPGDVSGSGKGGRITKEDVQRHLDGQQGGGQPTPAAPPAPATPALPPAPPAAAPAPAAKAPVQASGTGPSRNESRVPMTRIRATIAKRLKDSQNSAAMLTTFNEVNLSQVNALRARYKDAFEKAHGVKVGYMGFFVRAAVEALKRYPAVNASIDGNDVVYHEYYDIGVAVSSPRGLVVPVVKDVDTLSLAGVEKAIGDFGKKAKDNKLTMDDLTGGTFSITNGGVFGSLLSTPILNPPQSAILGMHGINERLLDVVVDADGRVKEIVKAPMMYLALTYDHRIIDGREAVLFLRTIKELLEDPARLLLEI